MNTKTQVKNLKELIEDAKMLGFNKLVISNYKKQLQDAELKLQDLEDGRERIKVVLMQWQTLVKLKK